MLCNWLRAVLGLCLLAVLAGCSRITPVVGGTEGVLKIGNDVVSDIQVNVFRRDAGSFETVGFGVTDTDGTFRLMTNGAEGPLWLEPGNYSFTVETAGAPIQFPAEYSQPELSPLKVDWDGDGAELELKVARAIPTG